MLWLRWQKQKNRCWGFRLFCDMFELHLFAYHPSQFNPYRKNISTFESSLPLQQNPDYTLTQVSLPASDHPF